MHCVFATKERRPFINPALQQRLWPYLGGIARENQMKALVVGGVEDHVHVLLSIPSSLSVAKSIQLLKAGLSAVPDGTYWIRCGLRPAFERLGYFRLSLRDINTKRVLQILVALDLPIQRNAAKPQPKAW
jgi:REP element-mobilizing transposase RayT